MPNLLITKSVREPVRQWGIPLSLQSSGLVASICAMCIPGLHWATASAKLLLDFSSVCCWTAARLLPGWRYTAAKWRRAAAKLLVHYCSTASTLTCKCMDLALAKHDGTKPADCSLGFPEIIPKNPPNHFFFLVHLFCGRTSNLLQICPLPEGFPSSEAMQWWSFSHHLKVSRR